MLIGSAIPFSAPLRKCPVDRSTLPGQSLRPANVSVGWVEPLGWHVWHDIPIASALGPSTAGEWNNRSPSKRSVTTWVRCGSYAAGLWASVRRKRGGIGDGGAMAARGAGSAASVVRANWLDASRMAADVAGSPTRRNIALRQTLRGRGDDGGRGCLNHDHFAGNGRVVARVGGLHRARTADSRAQVHPEREPFALRRPRAARELHVESALRHAD